METIDWKAVNQKRFDEAVAAGLVDPVPPRFVVGGTWVGTGTCCTKARRLIKRDCVCSYQSVCPDHGGRCVGTHD